MFDNKQRIVWIMCIVVMYSYFNTGGYIEYTPWGALHWYYWLIRFLNVVFYDKQQIFYGYEDREGPNPVYLYDCNYKMYQLLNDQF